MLTGWVRLRRNIGNRGHSSCRSQVGRTLCPPTRDKSAQPRKSLRSALND